MTRQVIILRNLFFVACFLVIVFFLVRTPRKDDFASVSMLDVGQGDSFLIQTMDNKQLLIDGGPDEKVLSELSKVMPRGDRFINVVIATHPDADHIGGLPLVLERYDVGLFLTSKVFTDTEAFKMLFETLAEREIPAYYARKGMTLSLNPSTSFSVLFPDRDTSSWETNAASVVGRLQIGQRTALFTGDSPQSVESYLVAIDPIDIDVDILKLGHHGSKTSSSEAFLRAASPVLALISAGVNNRYGHPASETINRLDALSIPWVSTQNNSTYTLKTDGVRWYGK